MEITNKKIPHNYRNKYLKNTSSGGFISTSNTPSGTSGLPYTIDEDGNYVVDKTITFKGNVLSTGEVCAYAENNPKYEGTYAPLLHTHTIAQVDNLQNILDSFSGGTGTTITVVDSLTSTSIDSALSANQGRTLKELIDNKSSVSSWDELLNKPSTFPPSTHAHSWDELLSKPSTFPPSTHAHDDRYYTESEVENKLSTKSDNGHGHSVGEISNLQAELNNKLSLTGGTMSGKLNSNSSFYSTLAEKATLIANKPGAGYLGIGGDGNNMRARYGLCDADGTWISGIVYNLKHFFDGALINNIGYKARNICIETDNSGNEGGMSSEINNWNSYLYLNHHSPTNVYIATGGGNVGIGTTSPENKLDINGEVINNGWYRSRGATGWYNGTYSSGIYSDTANCVRTYQTNNFSCTGVINAYRYNSNSNSAAITMDKQGAYTMGIGADGTLMRMKFGAVADMLTGVWQNDAPLEYYFSGSILATGEITAYSDIRLKSNIKKLTNRGKLNPITYTKDGKESIGFIAQEVKEIYPELVIEEQTENKYLSLNYNQLTAVLSAQINELTDKVNELTTQINKLKINNNETTLY